MKNTFLPLVLLSVLSFWSCKKESVDLSPAKLLRTIEEVGGLFTGFEYDDQKRLSRTITTHPNFNIVTTLDYSKAGQITETSVTRFGRDTSTQTSLLTLNGKGLVTKRETRTETSNISLGQSITKTVSESAAEFEYNSDNNLTKQIFLNKDPATGKLSPSSITDLTYKKRNQTVASTNSSSGSGNNSFSFTNTTTNGYNTTKNTLGNSYRGSNHLGVSSLHLLTNTTSVAESKSITSQGAVTNINETSQTFDYQFDSDGYVAQRTTTITFKNTDSSGRITNSQPSTSTAKFTYQ